MIPYIDPKFVEALLSLATDKSAKDSSPEVSSKPSARKGKVHFTPMLRKVVRLRSLIEIVVTKIFILLLVIL